MSKESIVLKNGVAYEIEPGATSNGFAMVVWDVSEFSDRYNEMSETNLEEFNIKNTHGEICATVKNKYVREVVVSPCVDGGLVAMIRLGDVDLVSKRLAALEAENAALKAAQTELVEGQNLQDEAIVELAGIVGGGE